MSLQYDLAQVNQLRTQLRDRMLRESAYVRQPNFTKLADQDLLLLYRLYDEIFLQSRLQPLVIERAGCPADISISTGMTSAGGKTTQYRHRLPSGVIHLWYEIRISSRLLFNSFKHDDRPIEVCGCTCADRLDAMMRIMEHELVHLIELLTFGKSSCSQTRFLSIAQRLFGHTHKAHRLVTTAEHALLQHNLRTGDPVTFCFEGIKHHGIINRISVRATVLVEHPAGLRYSNGKHYHKFYIPLAQLSRADQPAARLA